MADKVSKAKAPDMSKGPQDWTTSKVTAARVTSLLGRVTKGVLLSVGALTIAGVAGASIVLQEAAKEKRRLPEDFVLVMDFDGTNIVEKADPDPLAKLRTEAKQIQLSKVVDALHRAGSDTRVQGIVACIGDAQQYVALAQVQELRNAILDFRQAKADSVPTVAYSDSLGEAGAGGTVPYYLASAFDQIYVHETGLVSFTGFAASTPFLRGLLDKWHIKPLGFAREEYKSIVSQFTDKAYSKANREATEAWLNGWMGQIVHDVAAARGLEASDVCKALNASPLSADEAAAAGLITAAGHRSAAMRTLLHSATSSADPASLMHGGQVAEPSGNAAAELKRLKATELLKVEAMQNAVIAVNPRKSAQAPERDSAAEASSNNTRDTVLHSAAEQKDSARPAVPNVLTSAARFADLTEQTSGASSALEQKQEQSRLRKPNAKHGGRTQLQRIQAHKKPLDSALVIHVTPDKLQINCCLALPIDKYIQEHERKHGKEQQSIMQSVWALVTKGIQQKAGSTAATAAAAAKAKPQVAVITASGPIFAGSSHSSPLKPQTQINSTDLGMELQKARHDPKVKAVVLRVDSPGGSAVGSDAIYQEVVKVQQAGKPVVVSMGNLAASGGYYISASANKIVAQPGTITGSIGVAFGKVDVSQALRDQGVSVDTIAVGKNATASSVYHDFTKEQQRQVNAMVDRTYWQFLSRVAVGRNMSMQEARKVAKGRIWTGQDALQHGLVDKLGGLQDAVQIAKQEADLPLEADAVDVVDFPPPKSLLQVLKEALGEQPREFAAAALLAGMLPGQGADMAVWWRLLAEQLGINDAISLPDHAAGVDLSSGVQLLQQGPNLTSTKALVPQQSGLHMLCDPVIVR